MVVSEMRPYLVGMIGNRPIDTLPDPMPVETAQPFEMDYLQVTGRDLDVSNITNMEALAASLAGVWRPGKLDSTKNDRADPGHSLPLAAA